VKMMVRSVWSWLTKWTLLAATKEAKAPVRRVENCILKVYSVVFGKCRADVGDEKAI